MEPSYPVLLSPKNTADSPHCQTKTGGDDTVIGTSWLQEHWDVPEVILY